MSSIPVQTEFDIVIPVGPSDIGFIWDHIHRNKQNIIGHRNIYIVTKDTSAIDMKFQTIANNHGYILVDEAIFPFRMADVIAYHNGVNWRNGWYLQQLIKLYAGYVIPDILPTYLVVDADTVFLKPTTFIGPDGKFLFNVGSEYHPPYFAHMESLHPTLKKYIRASGICHHMIFNRDYVQKMMKMVEDHHNTGQEFWKIFLQKVTDIMGSGASEYEMYFNYMHCYHSDAIRIRPLYWRNTPKLIENENYDYVSIHHYMRA
jgi:hypothetical protein